MFLDPLGPLGPLALIYFRILDPFGPFWDPWPFAIMSDYETLLFLGKAGSFLERQEAFWKKQEASGASLVVPILVY